jgi:hypothetical protein
MEKKRKLRSPVLALKVESQPPPAALAMVASPAQLSTPQFPATRVLNFG